MEDREREAVNDNPRERDTKSQSKSHADYGTSNIDMVVICVINAEFALLNAGNDNDYYYYQRCVRHLLIGEFKCRNY